MRLFVIVRHAESVLNLEHKVNGDPSVSVALTEDGVKQARLLATQLSQVPVELCLHTQFDRTKRTAELAIEGRGIPLAEEPLLNDIDVGELEGRSIEDYRTWKRKHTRADSFPGGESLDHAALRYAAGLRSLVERDAASTLVVCHEIPLRYAINAAAGSEDLDGPVHNLANAQPYLFDERALEAAAVRIEELARPATARTG